MNTVQFKIDDVVQRIITLNTDGQREQKKYIVADQCYINGRFCVKYHKVFDAYIHARTAYAGRIALATISNGSEDNEPN